MLGDLFLKVTRIICLIKQGLNLWSRNTKWDLFKAVSMSFSNKLMLKDWKTGRPSRIFWISKRRISTRRRIVHEGKSASRYSDTKYTRDGRNEERSRTTSRRILCSKIERNSWGDTEAHFTNTGNARTDEFYASFRWISRSGIESQWERLSYVSSQPAAIPSSRSMLSRDKRLPLDTWNTSGSQENVFGNQCSTFDSSQNHHDEIHHQERQDQFHKQLGQGPLSQEMKGTIPMPTFARKPSTMSSLFRRIRWLDSKDSKCRNCNSTSSRTHFISMLEDKMPKPIDHLFRFSIGDHVMDQRSGDGRFIGCIKILAINCWKELSKFWDVGCKNSFCSEQDHPKFQFKKKVSLEGTESPKSGPVSTRKTDRFHHLQQLSSYWRSWYSIGLRRFILCHSSWR